MHSINGYWGSHSLKLSQPGVGYDGPKDRGQVAESHEGVIDGSGEVIVPAQEVLKVQHEDSCGQAVETKASSYYTLSF